MKPLVDNQTLPLPGGCFEYTVGTFSQTQIWTLRTLKLTKPFNVD